MTWQHGRHALGNARSRNGSELEFFRREVSPSRDIAPVFLCRMARSGR